MSAGARRAAAAVALVLLGALGCAGGDDAGLPDGGRRDGEAHRHEDGGPHAHADAAGPTADADDAAGPTADADDHGHADADAATADADAPSPDAGPYTGPARLSETGLYRDVAARALAAGVVTYEVRYPLWADGAAKRRYLWLPPGTTIDTQDLDHWRFPVGTRAWKDFVVEGRTVETRLVEKTAAGWRMAAYVWDDADADAIATPAGQVDAAGTAHDVPSSDDCRKCHRGSADGLIGVGAIQLGPEGMAALAAGGLLGAVPAGRFDPPGAPAVRDALGYLHGNCGHCHNDLHPLSRLETLRLELTVTATRAEDTPTYRTAIGAPTRHVLDGTSIAVVRGEPGRSQLLARVRTEVPDDRMPPLGTAVADPTAIALIEAWIVGLRR